MIGSLAGVGIAASVFVVAAWPRADRPMLALFPTGTEVVGLAAAIGRADGYIVDIYAEHAAIVSRGDRPDYAAALYAAGAWVVLDAAMTRLCVPGRLSRGALS